MMTIMLAIQLSDTKQVKTIDPNHTIKKRKDLRWQVNNSFRTYKIPETQMDFNPTTHEPS